MKAVQKNLYIHPNGVYYADFTVAGDRTRLSLHTADVKEARAALKRLRRGSVAASPSQKSWENPKSLGESIRPRFGDALAEFVENTAFSSPGSSSYRSLETNREHVRRLCRDWEDFRPVILWKRFCAEGEPKPNPGDVERLAYPGQVLWGQPRKSAPNQLLWFLRRFVAYAHERGWVDDVLLREVDRIQLKVVHPRRVSIPAAGEMAEFLAMCRVENPEIGDFVAWIAFSGLRLSGAAGLRWEEIDFAASRFRRIMKGGAEVYIPLLPEAADLLRARWERQAFPSAGAVWQFSDRRIKAVRRVMRKFADGLGLDLRYPHALRHHFASVALAAGLSAAEVARMLGHRDGGALVLRTYAHVVRDVLHQKVSQLRIGAAV